MSDLLSPLVRLSAGRRAWPWIVAAVLLVAALARVLTGGPGRNYDLLSYHFFTAHAVLHGRLGLDLAPAGIQTFFNPAPVLPSYLLLTHLAHPWSALALLALQALAVPAAVAVVREVGRAAGLTAGAWLERFGLVLSLLAPMWWSELGDSFSESFVAPVLLLGLFLALRAVREAARPCVWRLLGSGLCLGLAFGLKLTNGPFVLGAAAGLIFVAATKRARVRLPHLAAFAFGGAAGLSSQAWWHLHLARTWGSPTYPLFNRLFASPLYDAVNYRDWRWAFTSPLDFARYLIDAAGGTRRTIEFDFADARLAVAAGLALVWAGAVGWRALLGRAHRPAAVSATSPRPLGPPAVLCIVFVGMSGLLWAATLAYQRYLVPLELVLGAPMMLAARGVLGERWGARLLAGVAALSLAAMRVPDWGHAPRGAQAGEGFGLEVPLALRDAPAVYLLAGAPLSYVLPSLHPESRFARVDFAVPRLDERVTEVVAQRGARGLYALGPAALLADKAPHFERLGFALDARSPACLGITSDSGRFLACPIAPTQSRPLSAPRRGSRAPRGGSRPCPAWPARRRRGA